MEQTVNTTVENTTAVENTVVTPTPETSAEQFEAAKRKDYYMIDPHAIVVEDGFNCRIKFDIDDLVASIKANGVLNPISVVKFNDEDGVEKYRLVDGERRYRATMQAIKEGADIKRIPALYLSKSLKPEELLIQQVARNEGKRFTEYEYALACRKLENFGHTRQQIAKELNIKNDGQVSYMLQLLEMDEGVQELLRQDKISGAEIRRIRKNYKDAHNGNLNEKDMLKQILNAEKEVDKKNAERPKDKQKRITINDLGAEARTISVKDSKAVKLGLTKLLDAYNRCTNDGEIEIELDIIDILDKLNDGQLIDEIFENSVKEYKKAE